MKDAPLAILCLAVGGSTPTADEALDACFKEYLEADLRLSPMRATRLGDHRFDSLLDDLSAEARSRRRELASRTLERLRRTVDHAKLSRGGQVDYEIFRDELELDLWLEETEKPAETDPRLYTGLAVECVYALLTQSTQDEETRLRHAIARLQRVPELLAAARENLGRPSRVRTETAIQQNAGAIAFYERELPERVGSSPLRGELKAAAEGAVAALKRHQAFLESELLPRSTGEWRIGKEAFARKLARVLDAGISADRLLADAEAAMGEIRRDMLLVARQLWARCFPGRPLPPDDEEGRRETIRLVVEKVSEDRSTPETLARDARETADGLRSFIAGRDLLRLPVPDRCRIIEMPEFQRGNSVAFLDAAPALDPAAESIYAISPPPRRWPQERVESFLGEYNRKMLEVLTIHEAYPGHYVQLEYANRHPSLVRRVLKSGVYAEGWANYTEQMMLDEGYGDGDLALRLMQLKFFLRSAANAVLDHRMHCTEMSDDEALDLLTRQAFQGEGEARLKIVRAKLGSCQLSTYFVGRGAFMRLRLLVQRELGERFELGRFHEAVLEIGAVPVKYLPELTRARLSLPR